ncbi:MAG: GNAT family N-acetyltransferase [Bacteroidales bacterium]
MDATDRARHKPPTSKLHEEPHPLEALFAPTAVAVIGATERVGTVGRTILWNLVSNPFGGTVFPVNRKRSSVLGIRAYRSIRDVPDPVDLALIVTPAAGIPAIVGECVDAGVQCAVVTSGGFRETGPEGLALERRLVEEARRGALRLVGPNCLGIMSPVTGLNATYAPTIARPGNVAFISQSGALCAAVLDWSLRMNVGFSHFVSVGGMVDIGWGDLIDYLGRDPRTKSILLYMESIGADAGPFLSAAREVALAKPVIVIKSGRTAAAERAVASHTGALTGSDEVLDAAFRRVGVLRVNSIAELFYMAEVLGRQPRPRGPKLTIVTNAGGPGVIATDALHQNGGELARISERALKQYNELLPSEWSHNNPVDLGGDASPERYSAAVEIALADSDSDGLLVVLTPQAMTDPTRTAEELRPHFAGSDKPVLASWMGGGDVAAGESILNRANIPTFAFPDTAARVFAMMWQHSYNLRALYETPALPQRQSGSDRERVGALLAGLRAAGRTGLTEAESKRVLAEYGIPVTETEVARTADEAVALADRLGYPVAVKLNSETITHKRSVGGVWLNLFDGAAVRRSYDAIRDAAAQRVGEQHFQGVTVQRMLSDEGVELIIGASVDRQFGPVLLFGAGGRLVEVYEDRALALPPLNTTLARRMMEQTRIYRALQGARGGKGCDLAALEELLVRFSTLVAEQPWIKEIEVNPLLVSAERQAALDARIVLHGSDVADDALPRLAIRPYPAEYACATQLKNGMDVTVRPIRPEDEPAMVRFHEGLSERTVYFRYFHMLNLAQRTSHDRLTRICFIDYSREIALVAEHLDAATGERRIIGVGRITKIHATKDAEFAIVVSDQFQGQGLGTHLLGRLIEVARREGVGRVVADMLSENRDMQRICERYGFTVRYVDQTQMLHAELALA